VSSISTVLLLSLPIHNRLLFYLNKQETTLYIAAQYGDIEEMDSIIRDGNATLQVRVNAQDLASNIICY
jgi:hypothetical protein